MEIKVEIEGPVDLNTVITGRRTRVWDENGEDWEWEDATIGDLLVEQLLARLVTQHDSWGGAKDIVDKIRREVIRDRVTKEVEKAFAEPIQKTNSYGEPVGQAVTLRELIMAEVQAFFTKGVARDRNGNYSEPGYRDKGRPRAGWIITDIVNETAGKDVAKMVAAERDKALDALKDGIASTIAEAVKNGLRAK